ncbi:MAG: maleylacetoacetate isomerase [Candidatus Cloacimonadota bacterium]|nr:MAG: maleylacetoacetate isomerase [Candidatus Cloacimonadota bacterium]
MEKLELYTYFRSSCSYRVRIALAYKDLSYEPIFVNLLKGEQKQEDYKKKNPQSFLPSLLTQDGLLNQSLSIIEYLDEKYPNTKQLLPIDIYEKALVRSIAYIIACDVQPIQNLKVLKYLKNDLSLSEETKIQWIRDFIQSGFEAFEVKIKNISGDYCYKDFFSIADICLIPQVFNAKRFGVDMSLYPIINKVYENCMKLQFVLDSTPESQEDSID